jgi:hypothetical protein
LGAVKSIVELVVRWPSGKVSKLANVEADKELKLKEE